LQVRQKETTRNRKSSRAYFSVTRKVHSCLLSAVPSRFAFQLLHSRNNDAFPRLHKYTIKCLSSKQELNKYTVSIRSPRMRFSLEQVTVPKKKTRLKRRDWGEQYTISNPTLQPQHVCGLPELWRKFKLKDIPQNTYMLEKTHRP